MSRLVYGLHPVEELVRSKQPVIVIYYEENDRSQQLADLLKAAKEAKIAVEMRPRARLDEFSEGKPHQGVMAVTGDYPYREWRDVLDGALDSGEPPLLLVLDGIQDPQNLGALVRTAHVLGAHGCILPKDRAAGVTASAVKAAAGATEHMPIARCTNLARTLDELKEAGVWTVAAAVDHGVPPSEIDFNQATAIVLGSEGKGIRPLVLRSCDLRVRIPMLGQVASLNVSAAGAILLYEARRQRASAGPSSKI